MYGTQTQNQFHKDVFYKLKLEFHNGLHSRKKNCLLIKLIFIRLIQFIYNTITYKYFFHFLNSETKKSVNFIKTTITANTC